MTPRRTLDGWLGAARPADGSSRETDAVAVRVLARVAALEESVGEAPLTPPPAPVRAVSGRRTRRTAAALLGIAILAAVVARPSGPSSMATDVPPYLDDTSGNDTCANDTSANDIVAKASRGDAEALRDLRSQAALGRAACLERAERGGIRARPALDVLARLGGPVGPAEARRVADLHADPALADVVRDLLVAVPGDSGAVALAERFEKDPAFKAALSGALERLARGGRPGLALEVLRRAADDGCVEAAAACLRIGGASELDRALSVARPGRLALLAEAVREGSDVLRASLLRRVERGDATALLLAAASRIDALPELVRGRLTSEIDAASAVEAVATVGGRAAWVVLPEALEGPADEEARAVVRLWPAEAIPVLADVAVRHAGDGAAPFLSALAEMGEPALSTLERLASRPSLATAAVRAIGRSTAVGASSRLALLASRPALALEAVGALASRLSRGDATASDALLAVAREAAAPRAALEALASAGAPGAAAMREALTDPRLRRAADVALRRDGSRSTSVANDGSPRRGSSPI